jgi:hypothetical protein
MSYPVIRGLVVADVLLLGKKHYYGKIKYDYWSAISFSSISFVFNPSFCTELMLHGMIFYDNSQPQRAAKRIKSRVTSFALCIVVENRAV